MLSINILDEKNYKQLWDVPGLLSYCVLTGACSNSHSRDRGFASLFDDEGTIQSLGFL